jgi:HEAT repeat protein
MFRRAAIWALGYIGDQRGIALLKHLGSQDQAPAVRSRALNTLSRNK